MQDQPTPAGALAPAPREDLLARITTADQLAAAFLLGYRAGTRESYPRDLAAWFRWLAGRRVDPLDATRAHVELWVRTLELDGYAAATIARRLAALSGLYAYAEDEGLVERSPVRRVRRPRTGDESQRLGVDRDQLRRLLDVAERDGARSHALVCLLGLNGCRVSETLAIDARDLGSERGHRTVTVTRKGGKRQRLPLAPRTAAAVDALLAGRGEGPLFTTATGARWDRHAARKVVVRLARAAGIEHAVSPHTLRHGFATVALDSGVPLHIVQDGCGHADPRTTRRYDRQRNRLDRATTYAVASAVAS